jgi:hypothetical protein
VPLFAFLRQLVIPSLYFFDGSFSSMQLHNAEQPEKRLTLT